MWIIKNKYIPVKGFECMNLFGIIFVRADASPAPADFLHERIHTAQQREMLYVGFYVWYVVEWLVRVMIKFWQGKKCWQDAYWDISFEREAYQYQNQPTYLKHRHLYQWTRYYRHC